MGVLKFDGVDDRLVWNSLASALANVGDGAWTVAALVRRNHSGNFYEGIATLRDAGANDANLSFAGSGAGIVQDSVYCDVGGGSPSNTTATFTDTTDPYMLVLSKGAGSVAPRLAYKLGSGGAWSHQNLDVAIADQAASTIASIGGNVLSSEYVDGWIGVVAWWEGAMSDADKEALDNNWRTSDWWTSAHGTPQFLAELNVAGGSVVDLAGNASSLVVTGTSLDAAETLNSWTFDGTGAPPPPSATPDFVRGAFPFVLAGDIWRSQLGSFSKTQSPRETAGPVPMGSFERLLVLKMHPVLGAGTTTLEPAFLDRSRSTFAPTVSPSLAPGRIDHARATFAPTVSPQLRPDRIDHSRAVFALDLDVTIKPARVDHSRAIFSLQVNPQLRPARIDHSRATFAPTVGGTTTLLPDRVDHSRAIFSLQVNPQLRPARIDHARATFAPAVSPQLRLARIDHSRAVFAPNVVVVLTPGRIDHSRAMFSPGVNPQLRPARIDHSRAVFPPGIPAPPGPVGDDISTRNLPLLP